VVKLAFFPALGLTILSSALAADPGWVRDSGAPGDFRLADRSQAASILVAPSDFECVRLAAGLFTEDVGRVTGRRPVLVITPDRSSASAVIVGTLGHSPLIDRLVATGRLDAGRLRGQWETFCIATVDGSLVIAGSDRRGTAYGVFELSRAIGVSPWSWWADVTPAHRDRLFVAAGTRNFGPPSVQYRGIFINDEDWGLQPWAAKTFEPQTGNIGPKTYARICELLLRLKANTLWPAMHECSSAFNLNPENRVVADRYGIVMGSSHCEPLLRNNVGEWPRDNQPAYNFLTNPQGVTDYWEERLRTNGKYENFYTIGMRGIHDGPMQGPRGETQIVDTLEKIFAVQRGLLAKYVNPDPARVPQIFCPYKEVLAYYLHDLKVPPDVTIVFPDDNFGYMRYYPTAEQIAARPGGFGAYYHISYLGSPLSYVWLNTTPPPLIWEELSKAYDHGIRKFWMLNVGDLKPGEIGIDFFLQMAWDIDRWNRKTLPGYLESFAAEQFGPDHVPEIAGVLADYYRLGYQRKPEHLQWYLGREKPRQSTLTDPEELERLARYQELAARTRKLAAAIPAGLQDAFYELVEYPVLGSEAANRRFVAGEMAARSLGRNPAAARDWVGQFDAGTAALTTLADHYNNDLGGGKWRGIMEDDPLLASRAYRNATLRLAPELQALSQPPGDRSGPTGPPLPGLPPLSDRKPRQGAFAEVDGAVSMLACDYSAKSDQPGAAWQLIPGLGTVGNAMAVFPTTAPAIDPAQAATAAPSLEYRFNLAGAGEATVHYDLVPTQPLVYGSGLRFAVAIDGAAPQLVTIQAGTGAEAGVSRAWQENVLDNTTTTQTRATFATAGPHSLRIYMVDPGVVLERIVVDLGGLRPSYLGPPETLAAVTSR